jgi:sulfur carrier protein
MTENTDHTITVNGEPQPWSSQDIAGLLGEKGIDSGRGGVAVAVNGEVVPRAEWGQTFLKPDDRIEIVHIVRGG